MPERKVSYMKKVLWLVALIAGVMVAFTGCGGSSGGDETDNSCSGYDCVTDIPNPTIDVSVDRITERKVSIRITEYDNFDDSNRANNQLQFNDKSPCNGGLGPISRLEAEGKGIFECHIGTVSVAGGDTKEVIRCELREVGGEERVVACRDDSYDADYDGYRAWIFIPESGGELKYYVTGVQTPKTYYVPVVKAGESFYFGDPDERNGK
jgi:hypothetical protein